MMDLNGTFFSFGMMMTLPRGKLIFCSAAATEVPVGGSLHDIYLEVNFQKSPHPGTALRKIRKAKNADIRGRTKNKEDIFNR